MRFPLPTIRTLLAVLCLSVAACGSVANRSGTGGTSGSDAGMGGSGLGGENGGGGSTGTGGSAAGGMTGGAGGAQADAGLGDAGASDGPKIVARGAITPFGVPAPATGATVHVTHQRFGPTFACSGNVCFSGGLLLP